MKTTMTMMAAVVIAAAPHAAPAAPETPAPGAPVMLQPYTVRLEKDAVALPEVSSAPLVLRPADMLLPAAEFQDVAVPNLTSAGGTARPRYLQMRGVGEASQFAGEGPPNFSVGFLLDEIDYSGMAAGASLFDVRRVTVLRGPQADVYGSKALAGLIRVESNDPGPDFGGLVRMDAGNDHLLGAGVVINAPLTPTLGLRLSSRRVEQDGFRENVYLNRDDTNGRQEWFSRLKLRWEPTDIWRFDLALHHGEQDNGYDAFAADNGVTKTYSDQPGKDSIDSRALSLKALWSGSPDVRVLSITTLSAFDNEYSYDADWGNDAYWAGAPWRFDPAKEGYTYSFFDRTLRERRGWSQDLRVMSEPEGMILDGTTGWHAGLYGSGLEEKDDYSGFGRLKSDYETRSGAGYAQTRTTLGPVWQLNTGWRVEHRETDYANDQGVDAGDGETMWGGRASLEAALNDTWIGYGSLARGFKGGGANQNGQLPEERRFFDSESVWSTELGLRHENPEADTRAQANLFWMHRNDLQINTSVQLDPDDPTSFTYFIDNAAEGDNVGLEGEWAWQPSTGWRAWVAGALLDSEYSDYTDASGARRLNGREQPYAPEWTGNIGVGYKLPSGWFATTEWQGRDDFYLADNHAERSAVAHLFNASTGWEGEDTTVRLWARNLFDEEVVTRGFVFGLEPPDFPEKRYVTYGDPLHYGVTLEQRF